jgi:lycopene cyclase domain-containing protein
VTYTAIAVLAVVAVGAVDLVGLRTRLLTSASFWIAYAIMLGFQLLTNAVLTGRQVVQYRDDTIIGTGNEVAPPVLIGDGRILYAPVEDLAFGFAFIVLVLAMWQWLGSRGIQPEPVSGPPLWRGRRGG